MKGDKQLKKLQEKYEKLDPKSEEAQKILNQMCEILDEQSETPIVKKIIKNLFNSDKK